MFNNFLTVRRLGALRNAGSILSFTGAARAILNSRKACEEGWAPPPANAFQQSAWEKVHKIPDRPLTIEYDPQKDR